MKAKYYHYGTDCIIYETALCFENVFVTIWTYKGYFGENTSHETEVCSTNAEARKLFHAFCKDCKDNNYTCEYVEYN